MYNINSLPKNEETYMIAQATVLQGLEAMEHIPQEEEWQYVIANSPLFRLFILNLTDGENETDEDRVLKAALPNVEADSNAKDVVRDRYVEFRSKFISALSADYPEAKKAYDEAIRAQDVDEVKRIVDQHFELIHNEEITLH